MFGGVILLFWLCALIFTFNNSAYWYAYLFISGTALILASILLYHTELKKMYRTADDQFAKIKARKTQHIAYDEEEDYYDILVNKRTRKRRKKRKQRTKYIETNHRERKNTNDYRTSPEDIHRMSSIRNKEYLHTKIPLLYSGNKQEILFNTIQKLKQNNFFTNYYAGVTNEDLITHFEEYEERNIFELYDNMIPNTYAKVLYDIQSDANRVGIFMGTSGEEQEDEMLGFIALEDSYKADLLLKKYSNIQVFPTILGGTYKRVYKNKSGNIKIIKDFINYDLTISLAFYNN